MSASLFLKNYLTKRIWCCILIRLTRHRPISRVWRSTQAGRRGAPAKGVGRVTGARVRISPSPPTKSTPFGVLFSLAAWKRFELERPREGRAHARPGDEEACARSGSDLACAEQSEGRSLSRNSASDLRSREDLSFSARKKDTVWCPFLLLLKDSNSNTAALYMCIDFFFLFGYNVSNTNSTVAAEPRGRGALCLKRNGFSI